MKELMMNEDFSDVTLVTEDKKYIKAHMNILGAASPFFRDMLQKERSSSPTIYLRGIQFSEIESIMQFIYLGEATFFEERMDEFLAVAKSLEIKELCNAESEMNKSTETNIVQDDDPSTVHPDPEQFERQTAQYDTQTPSKAMRVRRNEVVNINGKYSCDQCDYNATRAGHLNRHIQNIHNGVKYACDQCDKQFTLQNKLKIHIQNIHEGIKYACDQCDKQFTEKDSLNRHIHSVHEGVKYACGYCDHQTNRQDSLSVHIKKMHGGQA